MSGPIRGASMGSCTTLETILAAATSLLGFGFCLSYSVKNSSPIDRFVETPTRVLNQSSAIFQIVFFLILVCVFDSQARISPHGEVNLVAHG
jgi:amino acid permease